MNPKNRTLIIVLAAVGLIVIVGAVAFLLGGDDDDGNAGATVVEDTAAATTAPESGGSTAEPPDISETRPVQVSGDPLPPLEDSASDAAVGLPTPVVDGATFDGGPMTIGGPTGGPTMYVFLAHWCPHCNDEIPELIELEERGDIPDGLNVVGISTAVSPDQPNYPPSQWMADSGWPWPVMADDERSTSFVVFGGSGFPYTVMADADGNVLARSAGSRSADDIKNWIDATLAGAST